MKDYVIDKHGYVSVWKRDEFVEQNCPRQELGVRCGLWCPRCYEIDVCETKFGGGKPVKTGTRLIVCSDAYLVNTDKLV